MKNLPATKYHHTLIKIGQKYFSNCNYFFHLVYKILQTIFQYALEIKTQKLVQVINYIAKIKQADIIISQIKANKNIQCPKNKDMTQKNQRAIIRTPSKLTDELVTVDSPKRQSRIFSKSMYSTFQFRKKLSESKNAILQQTQSLWLQSATSNTRDKSPSFRFTQAQRFTSLQQDERKNRLVVKLNLAKDLSNSHGVSFAKSKRIDHFKPKKYVEEFPSPVSYASQILQSRIATRRVSTACGRRSSLIKLTNILNSQIKGVTIPRQKNPSKVFMHHGQKFNYQPQLTISNPGVGNYIVNPQNQALSTKKWVIGRSLKKFNEMIAPNPGPGTYAKEGQIMPQRVKSANCKGTFQRSKRTYLVEPHPQDFSPSPQSYKIKRYLDN